MYFIYYILLPQLYVYHVVLYTFVVLTSHPLLLFYIHNFYQKVRLLKTGQHEQFTKADEVLKPTKEAVEFYDL